MKHYVSTRGGSQVLSFEETVFTGFLPDGGLTIPEYFLIKPLALPKLRLWTSDFSYPQIVTALLQIFIDSSEISHKHIEEICSKAFSRFAIADVISLKPLTDQLSVAELFHGPTLAFKDLALAILGAIMNHFLEKRRKHTTILVGTSGDTGSAAIEAVRTSPSLDIIVLYPKGRCTKTQELQMTTILDGNVHLFEVDGSSDDLDVPIKSCFVDHDYVRQHNLCSVNSINWTRILVQTAHFFYLYGKACGNASEEPLKRKVTFVIPTGGAGHLAAGLLAKQLGLPIDIVSCVNANDVFHKMYVTGKVDFTGSAQVTLASAMDIQTPYNIERILYLMSEGDHGAVKSWMEQLETDGEIQLPSKIHTKLQESIHVHKVSSNNEIKNTMRKTWDTFKYHVCPHTATAVNYYFSQESLKNDHVVLATASHLKFPEAQEEAGLEPEYTLLKKLENLPTKSESLGTKINWENTLRRCINKISAHRENK